MRGKENISTFRWHGEEFKRRTAGAHRQHNAGEQAERLTYWNAVGVLALQIAPFG
jgi:hypothetical protein